MGYLKHPATYESAKKSKSSRINVSNVFNRSTSKKST